MYKKYDFKGIFKCLNEPRKTNIYLKWIQFFPLELNLAQVQTLKIALLQDFMLYLLKRSEKGFAYDIHLLVEDVGFKLMSFVNK